MESKIYENGSSSCSEIVRKTRPQISRACGRIVPSLHTMGQWEVPKESYQPFLRTALSFRHKERCG